MFHFTIRFDLVVQYYDGVNINSSLKRDRSNSDWQISPLKKRQYVHQVSYSLPSSADHTGLLMTLMSNDFFLMKGWCVYVDDDDDDEDEESFVTNVNGNMIKTTDTKRDDSRRRAAHTAAEQKRRNAIRVKDFNRIMR